MPQPWVRPERLDPRLRGLSNGVDPRFRDLSDHADRFRGWSNGYDPRMRGFPIGPDPRLRGYAYGVDPRFQGWAAEGDDTQSTSEFSYVTFDAQTITVPISVCVFILVG